MSKINRLWVEKYRPETIDQIIFKDEKVKNTFKNFIKNKEIPNLLLSGVQGSGKTTLSLALVNELEVSKYDILTINASDETGIDAMREKIDSFSKLMPIGDFKIVRLEEMDFLSQNAMAILRKIIEDSSDTCRFICTCNYSNKIIPALKSRLQEFVFKAPDVDQVLIYAAEILEQENVEYSIEELERYVNVAYPDIRKIVNLLQQHTVNGKLLRLNSDTSGNEDYKIKLLDYIEKADFFAARKEICSSIEKEEYDDMYLFLYENIHRCSKFKNVEMEKKAIVTISDHLYKHSFYAHPHINLAALFINLENL